jgi:hypothetical protein
MHAASGVLWRAPAERPSVNEKPTPDTIMIVNAEGRHTWTLVDAVIWPSLIAIAMRRIDIIAHVPAAGLYLD